MKTILIVAFSSFVLFAEDPTESTNMLTDLSPVGTNTIVMLPATAVLENVTNVTWRIETKTLLLTVSTNLSTNWVTVETNAVALKQVGFIQTNRVLTLTYGGGPSPIILDILGKQERPSEFRTVKTVRTKPK